MKKFRWAMIICLLMIFIISGCESSKKRNPQDNNPPIEEEEVSLTPNFGPVKWQREKNV